MRRRAWVKKLGSHGKWAETQKLRNEILYTNTFPSFETRDTAEKVLSEFHNAVGEDGVKLLLRFADTKAQKMLKHQSNERRAYRAGEYNYSVEVVQGSTPSPSLHRLQQTASHLSPNSPLSFTSPVGVGSSWTPATSISPSYVYKFWIYGPIYWPDKQLRLREKSRKQCTA